MRKCFSGNKSVSKALSARNTLNCSCISLEEIALGFLRAAKDAGLARPQNIPCCVQSPAICPTQSKLCRFTCPRRISFVAICRGTKKRAAREATASAARSFAARKNGKGYHYHATQTTWAKEGERRVREFKFQRERPCSEFASGFMIGVWSLIYLGFVLRNSQTLL